MRLFGGANEELHHTSVMIEKESGPSKLSTHIVRRAALVTSQTDRLDGCVERGRAVNSVESDNDSVSDQ